jgi:CRISPR/Cas system-associated exonuclease Cas4 (RecB family)
MARRRTEIIRPEVFRQSLVAGFVTCPRRTRFALHAGDDVSTGWVEDTGDLGSALHEVAAVILATLKARKEEKMPHQEAIECMYETMRRSAIVLDFDALEQLRWLVLGLCRIRWVDPHVRVLTIEEELRMPVVCEDGEVRTLKGTPDVVMLNGTGVKVIDYKSGRGKPSAPRGKYPEPGKPVEGYEYLSERGRVQGELYGLLALDRYKPAQHYEFAEYHLRSGQIRYIRLDREQLEHVRRRVALVLEQLDGAIFEGPKSDRWFARSGSHCTRQCPVARSCPIPPEQRGDGVIDSQAKADRAAAAWSVVNAQRTAIRSQLIAAYETNGWIGNANEHEQVRYEPLDPEPGVSRKFGVHPSIDPAAEAEAAAVHDVADVFHQASGA